MGEQHQAVIVGAGFGGMGAAIQLKRQGIDDFVILEREDDLGGTWHVNRYPGLAVDIASVTYSYSFEPNPSWRHWYARGAELKKYADHVATTYDLRRHMRFGAVVEGATWDDDGLRVGGPARGRLDRAGDVPRHRHRASSPSRARPTSPASTTSPAPSCTPRSGTTPPTSTASGSRSSAPAPPPSS